MRWIGTAYFFTDKVHLCRLPQLVVRFVRMTLRALIPGVIHDRPIPDQHQSVKSRSRDEAGETDVEPFLTAGCSDGDLGVEDVFAAGRMGFWQSAGERPGLASLKLTTCYARLRMCCVACSTAGL